MNCPQCKSDNTQRAQVIHAAGTSQINTTSNSSGVVAGSGGIGFGTARTRTSGTQQTGLARAMAPPGWKIASTALFFCGLCGWLAGQALDGKHPNQMAAGLLFLAAIAFLVFAAAWVVLIYKPRHRLWLKKWFCHKCGTAYFEPDAKPVPMGFTVPAIGVAAVVLLAFSFAFSGSDDKSVMAEDRGSASSAPTRVAVAPAFVPNAVLTQDYSGDIDPTHKWSLPAGTELQYLGPAKAGIYAKPHSMFRFKQADCDAYHFTCKKALALPDGIWQKVEAGKTST